MKSWLLFISSVAFAGQSLDLIPSRTGSYTVPSSAPFTAIADTRIELRIHGFTACVGANGVIWSFGKLSLQCFLAGGTDIWLVDSDASVGAIIPMAGRTDILIRAQRIAGVLEVEVWNTETGAGYAKYERLSATAAAQNFSGAKTVGASDITIKIVWVHWFTTTVGLAGSPPKGTATADLANWVLDGDGTESVNGMTLTLADPAYTATPVYLPIASVRPLVAQVSTYPAIAVATAGTALAMDGTGSLATTDDEVLTYSWSEVSGPSTIAWSSVSAAQPTATTGAFGEHVIRLTVTDSAKQSAFADYTLGSVETDSYGLIAPSDPPVKTVFGVKLPKWGSSPWPYIDDRHMALADHFGAMLSDSTRADDWNTALAGTITATNGSATIAGSGTAFQTDFCNGGTTPANVEFVIWYPVGAGAYGRRAYGIAGCPSQTSLTLSSPYITTATTAGLSYAKLGCPGCWYGGGGNYNYYDNVLAFYSLYYRTGLTRYRTYARTLADRWWTQPYIDHGRIAYFGDYAPRLPAPRVLGLAGLFWRAHEGSVTEMWDGLRQFLTTEDPTARFDIWDMREQAYQTMFMALGALLDTDAGQAATWTAKTATTVTSLWQANLTGAIWVQPSYGYNPNDYPATTATVTNGSTTVTGAGISWSDLTPNSDGGWWFRKWNDTTTYWVTAGSGTSLTLVRPWEGASGTIQYQLNTVLGNGTIPFMIGPVGMGLGLAYAATGQATIKPMMSTANAWLSTIGYRATSGGLYSARVYLNCEPPPDSLTYANNCTRGDPTLVATKQGERFLNGEVLGFLARSYALGASTGDFGSLLAGKALGKLGGPNSDAYYALELDETILADKAKNFGFFFGIGEGAGAWFTSTQAQPSTSLNGIVSISGRVTQ